MAENPEFVRVLWMDAAAPGQLEQYSALTAKFQLCPSAMEDYGLVIVDEPTHIVLASQRDVEAGEYRRAFIIPKKNIIEVYVCKPYKRTHKYSAKKK